MLKLIRGKEDLNIVELDVISSLEKLQKLTKTEKTVLYAVCKGLTNKEIANELYVTVKTVKFHVTNIHKKLDKKNRLQLITTYMGKL